MHRLSVYGFQIFAADLNLSGCHVNCHSGFRSSPYFCTDAVHDPARFIRYEYGVTLNTFISNSFNVTAKLDCIVWF